MRSSFRNVLDYILWALITVKDQLLGLVSILICLTKSGGNQIGAILWRYSVGHYFI